MCDTLVLDMASKTIDSTECFTRKDWLSILDNQNQSYTGNQCICDTSQFANSNKWINYREGYFTIPLVLTTTSAIGVNYDPTQSAGQPSDWTFGLKNWYGSIIHSFALEYNGTTICQQVPFSGLWNTFKLMTSLSLDDVKTQGSLIGFYPDTAGPAGFDSTPASLNGQGIYNNQISPPDIENIRLGLSSAKSLGQDPANAGLNVGLYNRIQAWNFDLNATAGAINAGLPTYANTGMASQTGLNTLWQSYVFNKVAANAGLTTPGVWQAGILAVVYLKHIHSFFESVPLLKGAYLKMTLNLNQSSVNFTMSAGGNFANNNVLSVSSPLGGVSPLMLCSNTNMTSLLPAGNYIYSIAVGNKCLNSSQIVLPGVAISPIGGGSVMLNVPAYTFNPVYEQSYLSQSIKKIVYTDIYQYQTTNQITGQAAGGVFNILVSNGIANVKSVLVLPFYSQGEYEEDTGGNCGVLPFQSPYDPAGGGPTSPLVHFTQFNIQISGQNAIYNTEKYSYEQFTNQFKGVNAVNGGQTDGLTSGLVGYKDWLMEYCYYYVNCGRMLPAEEAVPKSIYVIGTNMCPKPIDLYIFVEYGVEISVDLSSGARV